MNAIAIPVELSMDDCDLMLAKLNEVREDLEASMHDLDLDICRWLQYREEVVKARATALSRSE